MLLIDEATHTYTVDGVVKPSVTQILSGVGVKDDRGRWNSISGAEWCKDDDGIARDFGKAVHAVAHYRVLGVDCDFDPAMGKWIKGLDMFFEENNQLKPARMAGKLLAETSMYSTRYDYCGTPDYPVVNYYGKIVIIDWKTSTTFQKHWRIQLAAYANLVKEHMALPYLPATITVRIMEEDYDEDPRTSAEVLVDFNKFLSCRNVLQMAA